MTTSNDYLFPFKLYIYRLYLFLTVSVTFLSFLAHKTDKFPLHSLHFLFLLPVFALLLLQFRWWNTRQLYPSMELTIIIIIFQFQRTYLVLNTCFHICPKFFVFNCKDFGSWRLYLYFSKRLRYPGGWSRIQKWLVFGLDEGGSRKE